MNQYKLFKNKKTKYHPSIHISVKEGKVWENIEITSSPTKKGKYVKLSKNPNPNTPEKDAWFRKYIRKDPIWAKGEEYANYVLCEEDIKKVNTFLKEHKKNVQATRNRQKKKKRKHGH